MERKNYLKEILTTVFLFAIVALAFRMCSRKGLSNGSFIIGRVVKADTAQGGNYVAVSFIHLDSARTAFFPVNSPGRVGDLYFVKIWKEAPDKVVFDAQNKVPPCFDTTGYPKEGWEEIPSCK
jgi:hypothetical protein